MYNIYIYTYTHRYAWWHMVQMWRFSFSLPFLILIVSVWDPRVTPRGATRTVAERPHGHLAHPKNQAAQRLVKPSMIWVCLKMSCTPKANGFADHYPYEKWRFHWEYIYPISDKPICCHFGSPHNYDLYDFHPSSCWKYLQCWSSIIFPIENLPQNSFHSDAMTFRPRLWPWLRPWLPLDLEAWHLTYRVFSRIVGGF